ATIHSEVPVAPPHGSPRARRALAMTREVSLVFSLLPPLGGKRSIRIWNHGQISNKAHYLNRLDPYFLFSPLRECAEDSPRQKLGGVLTQSRIVVVRPGFDQACFSVLRK